MEAMMQSMMTAQGGGAPGGAAGGGGGGAAGGMDPAALLGMGMKHMGLLMKIPAYVAGFAIAFTLLLVAVGPAAFRRDWAPTAGYDLLALALAATVLPHIDAAWATVESGRAQQQRVAGLTRDIQLMEREPDMD
jgi:hypothetical protein